MSELWKLTDSTGVYVPPQKHPMRTHSLGSWCGLSLFIDLDQSPNVDAAAIHELERHLGVGISGVFKRLQAGGKS